MKILNTKFKYYKIKSKIHLLYYKKSQSLNL
nr:MAG TPA: hypothetical protein [Caudoviricetes sp.]